MKLENIKKIYSENTGGGCIVDFLELENGLLLAVSDEYVGLYKNENDLYEGNEITGFWIQESLHKHNLDNKQNYIEEIYSDLTVNYGFFNDFDSNKIVCEETGVFLSIEDNFICFVY